MQPPLESLLLALVPRLATAVLWNSWEWEALVGSQGKTKASSFIFHNGCCSVVLTTYYIGHNLVIIRSVDKIMMRIFLILAISMAYVVRARKNVLLIVVDDLRPELGACWAVAMSTSTDPVPRWTYSC